MMMAISSNVEWRFEIVVFKHLGSTDSQLQGTAGFSSLHLKLTQIKALKNIVLLLKQNEVTRPGRQTNK